MSTSKLNRRELIQRTLLGTTAISAWQANIIGQATAMQSNATSCILLWMGGGMAAPDTFDPKHYEPFKVGLPVKDVGSTFPAIDTVADGIQITQGLEHIAKVMDRGTLIRSHVQPDLGHILRPQRHEEQHVLLVHRVHAAAPRDLRETINAVRASASDSA